MQSCSACAGGTLLLGSARLLGSRRRSDIQIHYVKIFKPRPSYLRYCAEY